ncbi:type IV pilus assembly protein PilM [Candidatus Parcubacteria bacterium]|nr:type IV pilus assembly protein PilM [Candidatus Parcubacteria bacterium]
MFSNKKSKIPIGINFSDSSIKAIQLSKRRDNIKIHALGKINLDEGIIENGEIRNNQLLSEKITELLSKLEFGQISSNEVIINLPENLSFTKLIIVENTPNKIEDIIESEIEKYVPYQLKDIYFDWQVIKRDKNSTFVLIGATPRIIVDNYINVINKAKLSIVALEIESTSICRSLLQEESPKFDTKQKNNYLIIDIGEKNTNLTIYAENTIISSLSLPISGKLATEKIAKTLEIDNDKAEKAKIICGLNKENANGIIYDILSEMVKDLNKKIIEIINYYNHQFDFGPINEIILTGGGANIKGLNKEIEKKSKIKTTIGNIFININEEPEKFLKKLEKQHKTIDKKSNKDNVQKTQNTISSYSVAIGLSLRGIYFDL